MFKNDSSFEVPPDDTKVWRYMDLTKFLSILETKSLFFPTVELLRHSDKWEGSWSNYEASEYVGFTDESRQAYDEYTFPIMNRIARWEVVVNCWHMSDHPSNAMWRIYLTSNEGIAIQTTLGRLKACFDIDHLSWPECGGNFAGRKVDLDAGQVEYIDFQNVPKNDNVLKQTAIYKRRLFEYENELRIVGKLSPILGFPAPLNKYEQPLDDPSWRFSSNVAKQLKEFGGVFIPIKVEKMIENIYVVPTALKWFSRLLEGVLNRYGIKASIQESNRLPKY